MFTDEITLGEVREWIVEKLTPVKKNRLGWWRKNPGVKCPACRQHIEMMIRPMTSEMARVLIAMYLENPEGWVHVQSLRRDNVPVARGGDWCKVKHWGLVERNIGQKADGNPNNGHWRLTDLGRSFVRGEVQLPQRVFLYNDECHGKDGMLISIRDALGANFNYDEMIRGVLVEA